MTIYKIINKVNGKFYIGSTIRSFKERWKQHFCLLSKNVHHCKHLQYAYNTYGKENFECKVVFTLFNSSIKRI